MDSTTIAFIGIVIGIIQLSIIVIQWCNMSKTKKGYRTILSTIWKKANKIQSKVPDLEEATGNELASGHASIEADASSIVDDIDEFRRNHWKQEPPSGS